MLREDYPDVLKSTAPQCNHNSNIFIHSTIDLQLQYMMVGFP